MPATPARSHLLADLRALVLGTTVAGVAAALVPLLVWGLVSPVLRGAGLTGDGVPGAVRDLAVVAGLVGVLVGSWVLTDRQEAATRSPGHGGPAGSGEVSPWRPR